MARAFLGLGANVGNRAANLRLALRWLAPQCRVEAVSSLYRSAAVVPEGAAPGPDYLNAACAVTTALIPRDLLRFVKDVEQRIGRRPAPRWAPRPIDVDILLCDGQIIDEADFAVPHPLLAERAFVLAPLAEIAGDEVHPVLGRTVRELAGGIDMMSVERVAGSEWADDKGGTPR